MLFQLIYVSSLSHIFGKYVFEIQQRCIKHLFIYKTLQRTWMNFQYKIAYNKNCLYSFSVNFKGTVTFFVPYTDTGT